MASLAGFDRQEAHRLIDAAMEGDEEGLRQAPDALREFFRAVEEPPPFALDQEKASVGARFFHKHSDIFFIAMMLSMVAGLTEGLSKASTSRSVLRETTGA